LKNQKNLMMKMVVFHPRLGLHLQQLELRLRNLKQKF
jgi:hypothetical protein